MTTSLATPQSERPAARQPLVVVATAFAGGIVIDRYLPLSLVAWIIVAAGALGVFAISSKAGAVWAGKVSLGAILLAVLALAAGLHQFHWRLYPPTELYRYAREQPQPVAVEMVALSGPRTRPAPPHDPLRVVARGPQTLLLADAVAIRNGGDWEHASGRVRLIVDGTLSSVHAGDRLLVFGQLVAPSPPMNPGEFDMLNYRRADRELSIVRAESPDSIRVEAAASRWNWRRLLGDLRTAGDRLLWNTLSHERAGLAAAILLGSREQLDQDENDEFMVTGTVHILSISGLHVGLLAFVLFKALRTGWMPRGLAVLLVALITGSYVLLTDSEPPAVRAMILVWVTCGSVYFGRRALGFNSLALAAMIVLAINPADLFRTGIQLSFLSIAALCWLGPLWDRWREEDALARLIRQTRPLPVRWIRSVNTKTQQLAFVGLMLWLATLPLVLHRFHLVSWSGLVLNVLLAPFVTFAMVSGFGVLAFGWLIPPLGRLCAAVCDMNLDVIEWTIESAANVPGSYQWITGPDAWWLVGFYALITAGLVLRVSPATRTAVLVVGGWIVAGVLWPVAARWHEPRLTCGFLSVGHGLAVVVELPNGETLLYDAGRLASPEAAARSVEAYLRSRRISRLDKVVLSHADIDHYNALPGLLNKFSVDAIYVSPQMFTRHGAPLIVLQKAIEQSGAEVFTVATGQQLASGDDWELNVLHPPPEGVGGNDNANSIVLDMTYADRRVLLTGDLEQPGVGEVVTQPPLDCDVLLAPHHGSLRSNPEAVVNWCTPEWAVISSGYSSGEGRFEPYERILGPRALNTEDVGAVRAVLSADSVEVRAWRIDPWH